MNSPEAKPQTKPWFPKKGDWYQTRKGDGAWGTPQQSLAPSALWKQQALYYGYEYRPCEQLPMLPLGPEDVPPGSIIRNDPAGMWQNCWEMVVSVKPSGIVTTGSTVSWRALQCYEILRPGSVVWVKCEKPVTK